MLNVFEEFQFSVSSLGEDGSAYGCDVEEVVRGIVGRC